MSYHVKRTVIYQTVAWCILCYTVCKVQCDMIDCFFKKNVTDYFGSLKLVSYIFCILPKEKISKIFLKSLFISSKKIFLSLTSFYQVFVIVSLSLHNFQIQRVRWNMNNYDADKSACLIFWITQKPLCIKWSKLPRWYIIKKGIFLNMFCNPKREW